MSEQLWLWHPDASIGSEAAPIDKAKLIFREPSLGEQMRPYRKPGTGLFKCLHERSYFGECRSCKRSFAEGMKNLETFAAKL